MRKITSFSAAILLLGLMATTCWAGVFDLPGFVDPGKFAIGLEPEILISSPTGAGFNLKPKFGVNDMLNWQAVVGTGTGARNFRLGTTADIEWFPDIDNQPGIATPLSVIYYRLANDVGGISYFAQPMIYKTFKGKDVGFTPFLALPVGWNLYDSKNRSFVQVAIGSMFRFPGAEHLRVTAEAGFDVSQSYSYISGGVTYYQ